MSHRDRHVVAGVDGSDASISLLDWAATYAATVGADLKLVGASCRHELPHHRSAGAEDQGLVALEDRLQQLVRQTCTGVPHQVVVANADPAVLLLRESRGADLIVVGAQFGDDDTPPGSAIQAVLRQASCPVVVVPTAQPWTMSTDRKEAS
jgi:nucleotide-binding universal stress UspA family protein